MSFPTSVSIELEFLPKTKFCLAHSTLKVLENPFSKSKHDKGDDRAASYNVND
jgi:hypothetical protein